MPGNCCNSALVVGLLLFTLTSGAAPPSTPAQAEQMRVELVQVGVTVVDR